jgi:hypothetical protein
MMKVLLLAVIAVTASACAAGHGIEAKLGYYREDTRQQSSSTFDKPLKCMLWENCTVSPDMPK